MELVSVIMPVYNSEDDLEKTVASVLEQSYSEIELIAVNDGSTDSSLEILQRLQKQDDRIKIVNQQNGGPGKARNQGIYNAQGEYVMFIDSDDRYESNMVEVMLQSMEGRRDWSICGLKKCFFSEENGALIKEQVYGVDQEKYTCRQEIIDNLDKIINGKLFNSLCNKIYLNDIIKKNQLSIPEDSLIGEDFRFNMMYLEHCASLIIIEKCLYQYRVRSGSLITGFQDGEFEMRKKNILVVEEYYQKYGIIDTTVQFWYIGLAYSCFMNIFSVGNSNSRRENYDIIRNILQDVQLNHVLQSYRAGNIKEKVSMFILKRKNIRLIYVISLFMARVIRPRMN